jgi:hypothetical protein
MSGGGGGSRSSGASGNSTLTGAPPTGYSTMYGGIPSVPDPASTASAAIGANIGNLGSLYQIGSGINTFNEDSLLKNLAAGLPGYANLTAASSKNISDELHGTVPGDVIQFLNQQAAERGVATGTVGSDNQDAAYLRALGLTSLDMTRHGEQDLSAAIARTPQARQWDPSTMFITPDQIQNAQMAANIYKAAPIPSHAAGAGAAAFQSGVNSGARGFPPTIDFGRGGGNPTMDMYNSPWANDVANPPALHGGGGADYNGNAYANWNKLASTWAVPGSSPPWMDPITGEDYGDAGYDYFSALDQLPQLAGGQDGSDYVSADDYYEGY